MVVLLSGLFFLLTGATAQNTEAPGAVTGRVLVRGESTPVGGAMVAIVRIRLSPPGAPPTPPSSPPPPPSPPAQTLTGPDGSYVFTRLEPGEYGVNVQKTGFAVGPNTPTRPRVIVVSGQTVQSPDVFMDRGGAIAGRVLDANGDPLTDARVAALQEAPIPAAVLARGYVPPPNRPRQMIPAGRGAQTNDLGEFRIFGLPPGEYIVSANVQMQSPFQTASAQPTTLAMTYFPGVTEQGSAQKIGVAAGETTSGIEIRMASSAAFLVSGFVVTGDGQPVEGAMVSVISTTPGTGPRGLSRTDARGRFQVGSVPSGVYHVGVASSSSGPMATLHLAQQVTITVGDGSVTGLRLVVVPK